MLLNDLRVLARPYWSSADRRTGLTIAVAIAALVGVDLAFNLWLSRFTKRVFDAVELRHGDQLAQLALVSLLVIAFGGLYFALTEFLRQSLEFRWRTKLTEYLVNRWFGRQSFYFLECERRIDNPDQRISEDVKIFTEHSMRLAVALALGISLCVLYSCILWTNGPAVEIAGLKVYGYLFWIAVLFGLMTNGFTHIAGRRLIGLTGELQKREANYRSTLTRQRDAAEQIAAGKGQVHEAARLTAIFSTIADNWTQVVRTNVLLNFASRTFYLYGGFIPVFAIAPQVLSGQSSFGSLVQSQLAFAYVATSIAFLSSAYQQIALLAATARRLRELDSELDRTWHARIEHRVGNHAFISADNLSLTRPDGTAIVHIPSLRIRPHERWVISGPSGTGKTTLVRAIAGLWIHGCGLISTPKGANMMMLTQRLYVPATTLRGAICYPLTPTSFECGCINNVMTKCGLEHLLPYLDTERNWTTHLSIGEQQRLGAVRALLQKPEFLIADEMTSALDEEAEAQLLGTVSESLTSSTIVAITHRVSLESLFHYRLTLDPNSRFATATRIASLPPGPTTGHAHSADDRQARGK